MNNPVLVLCTAALMAACASTPPLSPSQYREVYTPLTCEGADECGKLWRRAQIWVAENAGFKIQVATDAVIETYSAPAYSSKWAMRLVRIPREGAKEELQLTLSCGQVPLCGAPEERMLLRFKRDLSL